MQPGITAPPFHPNCRCTTKPYDEDVEKFASRIARDAGTGETFIMEPGTTYADWKKMQDEKYGEGFVDTARKKAYNEKKDWEQYRTYQNTLGMEAPQSFSAFQTVKYSNPQVWAQLKSTLRSKNFLQKQLPYIMNGEKSFIPTHTKFDSKPSVIAGKGSDVELRVTKKLAEKYHLPVDGWSKKAVKIKSAKYTFDVHWYEHDDGIQRDIKLKYRKENKKK